MRSLLENGANIDAKDIPGRTVLHLAVSKRPMLAMVRFLLEIGAIANAEVKDGSTVLHSLFEGGNSPEVESITELLLRNGVNIEVRDNIGRTSLLVAASRQVMKNVQFLIKEGADTEARDYMGEDVVSLSRPGSWDFLEGKKEPAQLVISDVQDNVGFTKLEVLDGVFEPRKWPRYKNFPKG